MAVRLLLVLLLTAVTQAVVALTHNTLTTDQVHTVLCVWTVAHRHFAPGSPLVLSLPRTTPEVARSALSDPLPQRDELQTANIILGKLHEGTIWPIELFRPGGDDTADTAVLHHSYILFVWNEKADSLNETLGNQLDNLKYSASWNPRGRFLVVATDSSNGPAQLLASHICSILWQVARIINVVVLISNQFAYRPLRAVNTTKTTSADRLNLYTWFPFKFGRWGEIQDVILLDEWVFEDNSRFSVNAHLYPAKVPTDLMGLPIKVAVLGKDPGVIIAENCTQYDDSTAYKQTPMSVEIVLLACKKMNLTAIFLPPSLNLDLESFVKQFGNLEEGLSDVLTGFIPLAPIILTSSFEATIPFEYVTANMYVPCPKAIPGTEKVLTTFSLSVWLATGLVLLLTTAVFWCAGNGPYQSVRNETHTYQSLSSCFQNTWSVLVGVSVPQQPTNSSLRVFFCLYVCFCFAISTVFQAFFVSYLVEPMHEKEIETFEELLDSDVVYGYHPSLNFAKDTVEFPEFARFLEQKKLQEDCSDLRKCVERMITQKDIGIIQNPGYINYVARELGTDGVGKIICYFDGTLGTVGIIVLFKKGNPLLDRFNILIRRYLEAGFPERFWREEQHRGSLKGKGRLEEVAGDEYFAFSIFHLMPAFVVLLVGNGFSSVVFIAELIVNCLYRRKERNRTRALGE